MSKLQLKWILIGIPLLLVTIVLGAAMFADGSAGGTLPSGRNVMAYSDSISLLSTFSADTATIETSGRKILVTPTSLVVDGMTVATINKDVADVQVCVKRGLVTFVADGMTVNTSLR